MSAFLKTGVTMMLVWALLAPPAALAGEAQGANTWTGVIALKPGDSVFVQTARKKTLAPLKEVNPELISLETRKGVVSFRQPEVLQVRYISPRANTYRKIATGMFIGVLGLAAVDLALTAKAASDVRSGKDTKIYAVGLLPVAGAAGAGIVFLIKGKGKKVYSVER